MKLLRSARLYFQEGKSDKVYEADLCEYASTAAARYVVNFRYGRRGGSLREGTKTPQPVSLEEAQDIFASLVVSKRNKGYLEAGAAPRQPAAKADAKPDQDSHEVWHRRLLEQLQHRDETKRTRAIWRIGEIGLHPFNPQLLSLAHSGSANQSYCVAWALGRLGQAESLPQLEKLCSHQDERVRRIATEARLLCLSAEQRPHELSRLQQTLPESLQGPPQSNDEILIQERINAAIGPQGEQAPLLETLYQLALDNPLLHRALCQVLVRLPLQPNFFRSIRHLYKTAELRLDGVMLSVLNRRFETTKARHFGSHILLPGERKYVRSADELKKPDSRIAFSRATQDYFRRRTWRICRRLGEIDDDRYIELATALLNAITDVDKKPGFRRETYRWVRVDRRFQRELVSTREYDEFAGFMAFNQILYRHSPQHQLNKSARAWERVAAPASPQSVPMSARTEAFPEIWDRHPQALVALLKSSRCAQVHDFALRALQDHADFCQGIPSLDLADLLQSPFANTQAFALELARSRLNPQQPDWVLVLALLESGMAQAQGLVCPCLTEAVTPPTDEVLVRIWSLLVIHNESPLRIWAREHRPWLDRLQLAMLLPVLVKRLLSLDAAAAAARVDDLIWLLCDALKTQASTLELSKVEQLLCDPAPVLQRLGAELLCINQIPLEQIPAPLFLRIQESSSATVRAIGIRLLNRLSDAQLQDKADVISAAVLANEDALRQASKALVARLLTRQPEYGEQLLQAILAVLFRSEPREGLHAELRAFAAALLADTSAALDSATIWRLLQAKSAGAREFGEWQLQMRPATDWSLRQWAALGAHSSRAVRAWVWRAYEEHVELVKADKSDALRLLASSWDDTREFALNYFRATFCEADWTPELLVHLVDHVEEPIQRFGRELITRFFQADAGPEYLAKLSQHPSAQVQLFASNFLQDYAAGHRDRILGLRQYFLSVLSQINRGRVAKDRVLAFLSEQAREDEAVAQLANELLTRLSATSAIQDKASFLRCLLALQQQYPNLATPLQLHSPVFKTPRKEVGHGV